MDRSKDAVAQRLAEAHYAVDSGIELIIQLVDPPEKEADPKNPIKLLEVSRDTTTSGIHPIYFGPHIESGTYFPSVIIEITPEEFEAIQLNPESLPNGWRLGREFAKAAPAGHQ